MKKTLVIPIISVVAVLALGGITFALTRPDQPEPVKKYSVTKTNLNETDETMNESTPAETVEETEQTTQPAQTDNEPTQVVEPVETVDSVIRGNYSGEKLACVQTIKEAKPEWFSNVATTKKFVDVIKRYVSPCALVTPYKTADGTPRLHSAYAAQTQQWMSE